MKNPKNKNSETTAVQSMKDFNKAAGIMESIAEAGTKEYLAESAFNISEETISKGNKANWAELTKVDVPAMNESFEPRFAKTSTKLNDDERVAVAASMKKYLAESTDDVINLNRLPGMSVVIANDTGLSPVAVEDYIDSLINESPAHRDSQQKAHDMTGRVDGAATTKETVPDDGMFPQDAGEAITGKGSEPEIMPEEVLPPDMAPVPEVVPTEPEAVAPEMEPAPEAAPFDEGMPSDDELDAELSALDDELTKELSDETPMEEVAPIEDDLDTEVESEDEESEEEETEEVPAPVIDEEEEEESFMESVKSKKAELASIKAKFESIANKYEAPVMESEEAHAIENMPNAEDVTARLEAIAAKINASVTEEAKMESEEVPAVEETYPEEDNKGVSIKLESIRQNLVEREGRKAKLESIRNSLFESIEAKKKNLIKGDDEVKLESADDVTDSRESEIKSGLEKIQTQLESVASQESPELTREEKIKNFKAKFESIAEKEFDEIEKRRLAKTRIDEINS